MHAGSKNGADNFINLDTKPNDGEAIKSFNPKNYLDEKGEERLHDIVRDQKYHAVKCCASINWNNDKARDECFSHQSPERLEDVKCYAADMRKGDIFPMTVLVHPSLHKKCDDKLVGIDGSRRLMAYLEADIYEIDIIVLEPKKVSS